MAQSLTSSRRSAPASDDALAEPLAEAAPATPWLSVVTDSVKSIRYGVVQIVIHDSRVVQVERTERTRFDVPQSTAGR
jgi:hypothetical protein